MISRKNICISVLFLCFSSALQHGYCSEVQEPTYTITETQLTQLETNLDELKNNNDRLLSLLSASNQELTTAGEQSSALKSELEQTQNELSLLKAQLQVLKLETQKSQQSLETANAELQSAVQSVKLLEDRKNRIERQRNFWEFIAAALGMLAAVK